MRILFIILLTFIVNLQTLYSQSSYKEKADKYQKIGNYNDAIVYYTLALEGFSGKDRLDIVVKRANCYQQIDNLNSALVDYSEIVDFYRKNPDKLKYMNSESKIDYVEFQFEFLGPLFFRAQCLMFLERNDEARKELNQYIQIAENNYGGWMLHTALKYRGLIYSQNGNWNDACVDWEKSSKGGDEGAEQLHKKYCSN